ncbi:2,5-dihydroxypyridine 5,6-dioxygenase (fragment) (plasmid) [Cupriavidus taiwanensis]
MLDKGDILLPQKTYVTEPIRLTVEAGFATRIEGGLHAELLSEYMASFNDPEAYAISHIGWGLQPRAHWSTLGLYDREATIAWMRARSRATSCFRLAPTTRPAAIALRPAISTSRCAAAPCAWTASTW